MRDQEAVDDLAEVLFAYDPGSGTTREVTAGLTRAIIGWALRHGWTARTEARVEVPADAVPRLGYVDVLVSRGDGGSCLAIEIDSADKPWSVHKLRHAAAAGMRPVWVRWGDHAWAVAYPDVDVIQLSAARRPRSQAGAQLALWS